ncbi:MAG: GNAT family N-acetyltransferase [Armatimonadetes bacterium]|nr:GNAT family N-acetyltransferase [Armatimonadota bacterium]
MNSIELRHHVETDIPAILSLLADNDPPRAGMFCLDYFRWQFENTPSGKAITTVADDRGEVVGFGALLPFGAIANLEKVMVYEGAEYVVKASHRGRGLFGRMVQMQLNQARMQRGFLSYAFPSHMSYHSYTSRLGYRHVTDIPYWLCVTDPRLLGSGWKAALAWSVKLVGRHPFRVRRRPAIAGAVGLQVGQETALDEEFHHCYVHAMEHTALSLLRDVAFMVWRYQTHPYHHYDLWTVRSRDGWLLGYAWVRGATISDLVCTPDERICETLLTAIIAHAANNGIPVLNLYCMANEDICAGLRRAGFLSWNRAPRPFGLYPRQRLLTTLLNCGPGERALLGEGWYFTTGDIDCKL